MNDGIVEIYCDESHPDILYEKTLSASKYLMIGSLWIDSNLRDEIKQKIKALKIEYNAYGELKWKKISPAKVDYYKALIDLFVLYKEQVRFRCIAVDKTKINMKLHQNNPENAFYKFYYHLLWKWIEEDSQTSYVIFCDRRSNQNKNCYKILKDCLRHPSYKNPSNIKDVFALNSKESVLLQFSDFLLGIASAVMNKTVEETSAKGSVILYLQKLLGRDIKPTSMYEKKYNLFEIRFDKRRK